MIIKDTTEEHDERTFEVGNYIKCNDDRVIFSTALYIYPDEEEVVTSCGDAYYDISISFDTFLEVAEMIKSLRKERAKDIKEKILRKENK